MGKRYGLGERSCNGAFLEIGPQQTLFMPGCWLKEGENEILVLDLKGPTRASIKV